MNTADENGVLPASLMTKREKIATELLSGLCAQREAWDNTSFPVLALAAVQQTDALLAVLAEPEHGKSKAVPL